MDIVLFRKLAYRHLLFNYAHHYNNHNRRCSNSSNYLHEKKKRREKDHAVMMFLLLLIHNDSDAHHDPDAIDKENDDRRKMIHDFFSFMVHFSFISSLRTIANAIMMASNDIIYNNRFESNDQDENDTRYLLRLLQLVLSSQTLQQQQQQQQHEDASSMPPNSTTIQSFLCALIVSMIEYSLIYIMTYVSTRYVVESILPLAVAVDKQQSTKEQQPQISLSSRQIFPSIWKEIYIGLFLPQLFHFILLFVTIYENTATVQILGSILMFGITYMTIHCIIERRLVSLDLQKRNYEKSWNQVDNEKQMEKRKKPVGTSMLYSIMNRVLFSVTKLIPGWPFLFGQVMTYITFQSMAMLSSSS
jgi:hypothetical protein